MTLLPLLLACGARSDTSEPTDTTSNPIPDSDGLPEPDPGCLEYRAEVYSDDTVCTTCPADSPLMVAGVVHNTCTTPQQFTTHNGCIVTRYSITSETGEAFPVKEYSCTDALTVWTLEPDEMDYSIFGPHSLPTGVWTVKTRFSNTSATTIITTAAQDTGG